MNRKNLLTLIISGMMGVSLMTTGLAQSVPTSPVVDQTQRVQKKIPTKDGQIKPKHLYRKGMKKRVHHKKKKIMMKPTEKAIEKVDHPTQPSIND